jgi:hypothetical protein
VYHIPSHISELVTYATYVIADHHAVVGVLVSCAAERVVWQDWLLFQASHVFQLMAVLASALCHMHLLKDLMLLM